MSDRYADLGNISSSALKEALLLDALKYLKAGGDWKRAIEVCDQLTVFYRDVTADLANLSAILVSLHFHLPASSFLCSALADT